MNQNYISRLKIKCLILFLFLLVYSVEAQTSENYAGIIPDYAYGLGKGVAYALKRDCSAALTSIEDVKVSQHPDFAGYDVIDAKLSVIEYYRLSGDRTLNKPEIDFSYRKPQKIKIRPIIRWWEWYYLVNIVKGNKAILLNCQRNTGRYVTTDVAYFDKIKQAIEMTEQFRADYVSAINYFANEYEADDELIKGAALNFLINGQAIPGDVRAFILVNMLNETPASKQKEEWFTYLDLQHQLLTKYDPNALPQYRKQTFTKIVQIASGDNQNAVDATRILVNVAKYNPDELRSYLKSGNRGNIMINLQKLNISGDFSPEPLRNLLSEQ